MSKKSILSAKSSIPSFNFYNNLRNLRSSYDRHTSHAPSRPLAPDRTEIVLEVDVEPSEYGHSATESRGNIERQTEGDLQRLRDYFERLDEADVQ